MTPLDEADLGYQFFSEPFPPNGTAFGWYDEDGEEVARAAVEFDEDRWTFHFLAVAEPGKGFLTKLCRACGRAAPRGCEFVIPAVSEGMEDAFRAIGFVLHRDGTMSTPASRVRKYAEWRLDGGDKPGFRG